MFTFRMFTVAATLALAGVLPVSPVATALDAQESANIQSQCRREAQDYGIAPEQMEEYVRGCIMAYGGMPEPEPEPAAEAPPVDNDVDTSAVDEQDTEDAGEQDTGAVVE
ncbi:MAG: hypothetical protein WCH04_21765 [Gammaproteobacteria bacterium]